MLWGGVAHQLYNIASGADLSIYFINHGISALLSLQANVKGTYNREGEGSYVVCNNRGGEGG